MGIEELPIEKVRLWREKPVAMVDELFGSKPDAWQVDALEAFPVTQRIAMKSAAGCGKTALLAWVGWNFLLTRPDPMVGATSITGQNLKANLWPEMTRWMNKSPLLSSLFEQTSTAIYLKQSPATWRMEARTWPQDANKEQIGNALRGLHADYIMWLMDESGAYPDSLLPVVENILSGSPAEAHILQAGNPTNLSGPLYHACTKAKDLWKVIEITADPDDPKRSSRVDIEHARAQIRQYGRDNPWVMINILGKFPPSALNALIGPDEVAEAMSRVYNEYQIGKAALVLGTDVARFGDDQSCIAPRRGIQAFEIRKYRNLDSTQGASQVNRIWHDLNADACFIDDTGGFGAGWIDQLRLLKRNPIGIGFATKAHDPERYYNKRSEMHFDCVEWIKRGGALPNDPQLTAALTSTTYTFRDSRLLIEPKESVKAKIGYSPDALDSLCLTFAEPVILQPAVPVIRRQPEAEYNPYREVDRAPSTAYFRDNTYNPYGG